MRVLLAASSSELVGLEYISATLKKQGHSTQLLYDPCLFNDNYQFFNQRLAKWFSSKEEIVEKAYSFLPDLVGITMTSFSYGWACSLAVQIRKKVNVPVVFGGIHPTLLPEETLQNDFVDYVCVGEGEDAFLELADKIESGADTSNILNIWSRKNGTICRNPARPLVSNLDLIPFADKSLFEPYINIQDCYTIFASRGCSYHCSFCQQPTLSTIYGNPAFRMRKRSVDNVIEELLWAKQVYKPKMVRFHDNVFAFDKVWMREFTTRYSDNITIPFKCNSHPSVLDKERIMLLKKSGCYMLEIGVQSLNEQRRKEMLNRHETNRQIQAVMETCHEVGLKVQVDHILDLPQETEEELKEAVQFYAKYPPSHISAMAFTPFAKTDILRWVEGGKEEGVVQKVIDGNYVGFHNYNTRGSKAKVRMLKGIRMLFNFIPIFPAWFINFLVKVNGHKLLGFFPDMVWKFFHLLGGITSREIEIYAYMKYHLFYFLKMYPKDVHFTDGNGSRRTPPGFVSFPYQGAEEAGKRI